MSATRPPLDYLATCSQMSLESVELSRLNLASNLRKEFQEILDEWIESEVDARLARSILEWRRAQDTAPTMPVIETVASSPQFEQLAIAFLPQCTALPVDGEAVSDKQPLRVDLPPKRERLSVPAQLESRTRKRAEGPQSDHEHEPAAGRNDERAPVAAKHSRSIELLSLRSASLAKAAAANLSACKKLVALLDERPRANRKYTALAEYLKCPLQARQPAQGRVALGLSRGPAPKWSPPTRLARRAVHAQDGHAAQYLRVRCSG